MECENYKECAGRKYFFFDSYHTMAEAEAKAKQLRVHGFARIEKQRVPARNSVTGKPWVLYVVWKSLRAKTRGMPDYMWIRWGQ